MGKTSRSPGPRRAGRIVFCRLSRLLATRGISSAALARRAGLPTATIARLRRPDADPSLVVAERVARALDLPIEALWRLEPRRATAARDRVRP